jgi:hypothetical protein
MSVINLDPLVCLKRARMDIERGNCEYNVTDYLDTIEASLLGLQSIKEANPSEALNKLDYIKSYLKTIQPFMLTEMKSQEKFENAICVLDGGYRISLYIKVDSTKGEEVIVSFHENNYLLYY